VDGRPTGLRTPQQEIKLSVGQHQITLANASLSINETFAVEIKPGEIEKQIKDYSNRISDKKDADKTTINPFHKKPNP
jgi:hypothetical protein